MTEHNIIVQEVLVWVKYSVMIHFVCHWNVHFIQDQKKWSIKEHSDFPYASIRAPDSLLPAGIEVGKHCQSWMSLAYKDFSRDQSNRNMKWPHFRVMETQESMFQPALFYRQGHKALDRWSELPKTQPRAGYKEECGPRQAFTVTKFCIASCFSCMCYTLVGSGFKISKGQGTECHYFRNCSHFTWSR